MKVKYDNQMMHIKTSLVNELCILDCAEKNLEVMFSKDEYKNIGIATMQEINEKIRNNVGDALTKILSAHPTLFTVYKCESIKKELDKMKTSEDIYTCPDLAKDSEELLQVIHGSRELINATIKIIPDRLCPRKICKANENSWHSSPLLFIQNLLNIKGGSPTC